MDALLNDETLVDGDIVSTPNGFKVFRGRPTVPHSLADFQQDERTGGRCSWIRWSFRSLLSQGCIANLDADATPAFNRAVDSASGLNPATANRLNAQRRRSAFGPDVIYTAST